MLSQVEYEKGFITSRPEMFRSDCSLVIIEVELSKWPHHTANVYAVIGNARL